ncbi:fatty acid synthase [Manduca sexta]|uniref:fatty acid synthase n=1 Tax=Manduca sexta TaxID=7130 RepID=UPI00188E8602|nr:fatty acid synthase [Manduca sexta]
MVEPNRPQMSLKHPDMPKFMGKINEYYKFDNHFFKVPYRQTKFMEPYNRKLLEEAYSAIFDAGVNPASISSGKIGVFIGSSFSDQSTCEYLYNKNIHSPYKVTGCSKGMLSNRISYWIDGKAMSYTIDADTASSTVCLTQAYKAIRNGLCDAAIVGGCNHCLNPMLSVSMRRAGLLTLDGKTKCFDKNGDGYVRSEACGTIFLQRAKDAKRIYCEVYYAKEKFFMSPGGVMSIVHQPEDLEKFLYEFYNEIDISPDMVEYIEANAVGIAEADSNELQAIANIFAKNKSIKIGSVKSNMGHGEAASGICSLIKICLANHTGIQPANLHYHDPPDNITALKDGRIQVVTNNMPLNRGYVALNSFSFGGSNAHVLLKNIYKPKDKRKSISPIPHLVLASARTESGVKKIINYLKNKPIDPEEIALLHNFYSTDVSGHAAKGYVILDTDKNDKTITSSESTQLYNGAKRPVWFLYSGMGSQWASMGASLMRIPIFAAAVQRCCKVLEPKGVDIIRILTEPDETIFDNIMNSFIGIAVVQIGLTDVLKELEIVPDNVIGHSVGELGCAYALGCLTAEEMVLAGYYRGLISVEEKLPKGAMAAVGLGYKDVLPICPPEIDIACHNSSASCTISGPCEDVMKFIVELKSRDVFFKELRTSNIAYHSRYVAKLGDMFRSKLEDIVPINKLRTNKWLSTSILPQNWDKPEAQYCSAEYFNNNFLSSVYFEEVATMIPSNAIVIEIAPHGLLQSILKSSHESCIHVPLAKRNHHDSLGFLLDAIGKLYEAGLTPKIDALYPKVTFPVSTKTPILSHLVEWEHSEDWLKSGGAYDNIAPSREVIFSVHDDEWSFMKEHARDGIPVVPEAAILFLVWEELGNSHGVEYNKLSIGFTNVEFHGTINHLQEDLININVNIMRGSEKFEVKWKGEIIIATGYIHAYDENYLHDYVHLLEAEESNMRLNSKDVYTIMNLRGHSYGSKMQSIHLCNFKRNEAKINWNGNWIMLLDSLLQLGALATDYTDMVVPVYINQLFIDTLRHEALLNKGKYNAVVTGVDEKIIRCGPVEIKNIVYKRKPRSKDECVVPQKVT